MTLSDGVDEKPIPFWQKIVAVVYVAAAVALAIIFRSHLAPDFIPIDHSNIAPNILANVVILIVMTPVGVLIWPPTRRRLLAATHRFADTKLDAIHGKLDALEAHHRALAARHDDHDESLRLLHQKLDALSTGAGHGSTRADDDR